MRDAQETCYFKSTDGHHGHWAFSVTRLNLHLLDILSSHGGLAIVDATRKGKRFPVAALDLMTRHLRRMWCRGQDALTKTIPIWIAVLNRVLFPQHEEIHWYPELSISETDQLERRLEEWASAFRSLNLDVASLRERVKRPMRPYWTAPNGFLSLAECQQDDCHPILLVSASSNVHGSGPWKRDSRIAASFEYLPGAKCL